LKLAPQHVTIDDLRYVWRVGDEAGFDHLWDFDHFAPIVGDVTGPIYEGWMLLAAMAEDTKRVRIGCMVTGNTYRHPAVLAKMAVTVDHLSGGRLEFGIGAGWAEIEHQMLGLEFHTTGGRIRRMKEAVEVCKALWTQPKATYEGRYYQLHEAVAEPKPVQKPHPPIWIGGGGEQLTLRFVAELADAWNFTGSPAEAKHKLEVLDRHCAEVGRDPAAIRRTIQMRYAGDPDDALRTCEEMRGLGFEDVIFTLKVDAGRRLADEVAEKILPRLRGAA
jgi:F420-dependent oxidoreductase-like protein